MTATMDFHTELITIQNELKKYIFHHQMLRLNKQKTNDTKTRLILYEKKIVQLSERQKAVVNNLRKERIKASNLDHHQLVSKSFLVHNQSNLLKPKTFLNQQDKQQQLRSFNNGKKLFIPVSAAAATSKKTNQQILVVPTADGGARLAASTTNASRSTLTKSSFNKNSNGFTCNSFSSSLLSPNKEATQQFNNVTINNSTKSIATTLSNNLKNSRFLSDRSSTITTNSLLPNEPITTASTKRKQQLHGQNILVDRTAQLFSEDLTTSTTINNSKIETKIDEVKEKEEFMIKLGLVTKQALKEIQNKKSERKRRTTANPQFSNAAIEAKRISAQELAAKKANRKRELAASNQDNSSTTNPANKRSFLNSNRGKQVVGNKQQQDIKKNLPSKSISNSSKQVSQNNNVIKISRNCFVCDEVCDSDLDEIMFCQDCHCLFHLTCSSTIDRIKKTMGVSCPKCKRKQSLADDGFNDYSNESNNVLRQKALDSSNSNSSSVVGGRTTCRRIANNNKLSKNLKSSNKSSIDSKIDQTKQQNNKSRSNEIDSKLDDERYEFLVKYQSLDRQVRDFRVKLALLKDKVCVSKEHRREYQIKKENSKRDIDSIINIIKMIKELENVEQKENQINQPSKIVETVSELNEVVVSSESLNEEPPTEKLRLSPIIEHEQLEEQNTNQINQPSKIVETDSELNEVVVSSESLNEEPPTKKLRLSPIMEHEQLEEQYTSQDLDDEVSAAIASIQ